MATHSNAIKKIGQFLSYVLGRRPDEFGLVPDDRGYIPTKELLKAIHQEDGWRHVRLAHLQQIIAITRPAPVEIEGHLVRSSDRSRLPVIHLPEQLPKLLYLPIRRRAYATVRTKGLSAGNRSYLILSPDRDMALKMGSRLDHQPVLLTVQVAQSQTKGTHYRQYGERLFLADTLAIGTFSGPAPPKEREPAPKSIANDKPAIPKTPGSYFPEFGPTPEEKEALKRRRRHQKMAQEKERRQARRDKSRRHR